MTFDHEWAELVDGARQKQDEQSVAMQLNHTSPGRHSGPPSGARLPDGGKRLHVTPTELRKKASKADDAAGDFFDADNKAMKETGQVKDSLSGFECAAAFDDFQERWREQMRHLQNVLHRGIGGGLRSAATNFDDNEQDTKKQFGGGDAKKPS